MSTINSLLREFDEIGQVTTDLIGLEQIAQIKALEEQVQSLKKELDEKNEQLRFSSSQSQPSHSKYAKSVIADLIQTSDETQRDKLIELQSLRDPQSVNEGLISFLLSAYQRSREAEGRLTTLLRGHVAFLENLLTNPDDQASFLIQDGDLSPRAKRIVSQQCNVTKQLIADFKSDGESLIPGIDQCGTLIPTDNLKRLLEGETVSYQEMEAIIWHESALIFVLQRKLNESSEVTRRQIRMEVESEIRQDLEDQIRLSIESDVRKQLETEIRSEIEDAVKTEVELDVYDSVEKSVRSRLERELTPKIKAELSPKVERELAHTLTPVIMEKVHQEMEQQIVAQTERKLRRELTARVREEVKDELRPEIERSVRLSMTQKLEEERREMEDEIREEIEKSVREDERRQIKSDLEKSVRLSMKQEFDRERSQMEEEIREEVERSLREERTELLLEEEEQREPVRVLVKEAIGRDGDVPFMTMVEDLASEVIALRKQLGAQGNSLAQKVADLIAQNEHMDQLHTQTRSLLVRQAHVISELRDNGGETWKTWAKGVSKILGLRALDDEGSLRVAIEDAIADLMPMRESR